MHVELPLLGRKSNLRRKGFAQITQVHAFGRHRCRLPGERGQRERACCQLGVGERSFVKGRRRRHGWAELGGGGGIAGKRRIGRQGGCRPGCRCLGQRRVDGILSRGERKLTLNRLVEENHLRCRQFKVGRTGGARCEKQDERQRRDKQKDHYPGEEDKGTARAALLLFFFDNRHIAFEFVAQSRGETLVFVEVKWLVIIVQKIIFEIEVVSVLHSLPLTGAVAI